MTTPHKLYPPITSLRGDEGENDATLAIVAVLTPSPHYPDEGRIIAGSPPTSDAVIGGWSSGSEAAVRIAETLLEAALDVDAAMDADRPAVFRFGVEPPDVDLIEDLSCGRCEVCCARIATGELAQAFWEESRTGARVVLVHAERCPEVPLWHTEWKLAVPPRWAAADGWIRSKDSLGRDVAEPYEEALALGRRVALSPAIERVRLVRAGKEPTRG